MRIVGGESRGRKLCLPPSAEVRPTTDRVREALFSTISSMREIKGLRVLDLFAGSGVLGIEALSRGARFCLFVEQEAELGAFIGGSLSAFGYEEFSEVLCHDAYEFLAGSRQSRSVGGGNGRVYDLVFADPPYRDLDEKRLFTLLVSSGMIHEETLLVVDQFPLDYDMKHAATRYFETAKRR